MPSWEAWARLVPVASKPDRSYLIEIARYADQRGIAKLSRSDLADVTGATGRTVSRRLASLEATGLIHREQLRGSESAQFDRLRIQLLRRPVTAVEPPAKMRANHVPATKPETMALGPVGADDLRAILLSVADGAEGSLEELGGALTQEGPRWFRDTIKNRHVGAASADEADTISIAYEQAVKYAPVLAAAVNPWALLSQYVRLGCKHVDYQWSEGLTTTALPDGDYANLQPLGATGGDEPAWGYDEIDALPELRELVDALIDAGMDPSTAEMGTAKCLSYLAEGVSHRHQLIAKDKTLHALGIGPDQARAWLSVITGSRRNVGGLKNFTRDELADAAEKLARSVGASRAKVA